MTAAGVALATVFTAWTPNTLLPNNVADEIAAVIATSQSQIQGTPTALPVVATLEPPQPKVGVVAGHNGPQNDPGSVCPNGVTEARSTATSPHGLRRGWRTMASTWTCWMNGIRG